MQLLVVALVCVAVYWVTIGRAGLFDSEAQRVLPGWTMYEGGDAFVPHLFERPYARKPPGMPWAVAASAWLLGESEFAARSVSALSASLIAILACAFAHHWLGRRFPLAGLVAGLAQSTLPLMLAPATAAEIEMFNNLWTALASLCVIDLMLGPRGSRVRRGLLALGVSLGTAGMIITKGPAALPVVGAALAVGCVLAARHRLAGRWERGVVALLSPVGGMCFAASVLLEMRHRLAGLPAELVVLQDPREFLWNLSKFGSIITLPIVGWASALPGSLAVLLLLPRRWWGAADTTNDGHKRGTTLLPCIAIAWSLVIALLVYMLSGVSNPRYTMPAMGLLGPAIAAVVMLWIRGQRPVALPRAKVVSVVLVGLVIAAIVIPIVLRSARMNGSGESAAQTLSQLLPAQGPCTIWADGAIETRAEIPYYITKMRAAQGHSVTVRWWPILSKEPPIKPGDWYLLRHDTDMDEWAQLGPRAGAVAGSCWLKGKWVFALAPAIPAPRRADDGTFRANDHASDGQVQR